jgi:hypothetical protein
VRAERPLGLVVALIISAVLLAACDGGDDHAKVEASLRQYISGLSPEEGPFPVGAGPPRVNENACKDRHVKLRRAKLSCRGLWPYISQTRSNFGRVSSSSGASHSPSSSV